MQIAFCLNPYSNGLLSECQKMYHRRIGDVLILILMDYSLSLIFLIMTTTMNVLILILMDYSLS